MSLSCPSRFLKIFMIVFWSIELLLLSGVLSKIKLGNHMLFASSGLIRLLFSPLSRLLNLSRSSNHFKNIVNSAENSPATASKEESRLMVIEEYTTILSFSWPSCVKEMLPGAGVSSWLYVASISTI